MVPELLVRDPIRPQLRPTRRKEMTKASTFLTAGNGPSGTLRLLFGLASLVIICAACGSVSSSKNDAAGTAGATGTAGTTGTAGATGTGGMTGTAGTTGTAGNGGAGRGGAIGAAGNGD